MHARTISIAIASVAALALVSACGRPQAGPENQRLIASMRTALSAQNADWLQQNADLVEQRRGEGKMSDGAYKAFQNIIQKARDGQWQEAERDAVAFQKAQKPRRE